MASLANNTISKIEDIANELIYNSYDKTYPQKPPIDLKRILKFLQLDIKSYDFQIKPFENSIEGAYLREKKLILVSKNSFPQRQNFTIAHEIGHHILHKNTVKSEYYRTNFSNVFPLSSEETEANWFAASLLMPYYLIDNEVGELNSIFGYVDVPYIANLFKVSVEAMNYRIETMKKLKINKTMFNFI